MLSDGRVRLRPLAKMSCLACGAAFHATANSGRDIRTIYNEEYALAAASPKSDAARAQAYRRWIQNECPAPASILEIGCGSGTLLSTLLETWPDARGYGIDPALPEDARSNGRIHLERGFIEDLPDDANNFDLIVAVNVIEHTSDPGSFLAALRRRLAAGGTIVIICPLAQPPNVELLFFDHLFSLTSGSLRTAGRAASLVATRQTRSPPEIGDFQMSVFVSAGPGLAPQRDPSFAELLSERQSYLERWSQLDEALLDRTRTASRFAAFGGGQTAALLRAYAPRTWVRVESIMLDDVNEAWRLGPPVTSYRDAGKNRDTAVLIATAPRVQNAVAERLRSDGLYAIAWNDLIPN
jgi:SAM-dependent methyltransferase